MFRWYAIHTHPRQEFSVKAELERRALDIAPGALREVAVPTERSSESRSGQTLRLDRRAMPGYVLVETELTEAVWALIRGTRGVAGIVGSANRPVPLTRPEVERLLDRDRPAVQPVRAPFGVGDVVDVISGPLVGLSGPISEINESAERLKARLPLVGREINVQLEFDQVKPR